METKKTWEKCLSRAYHSSQALALPQDKDKQRKSLPTPSEIYTLRPEHPRHTYTQISPQNGLHLII